MNEGGEMRGVEKGRKKLRFFRPFSTLFLFFVVVSVSKNTNIMRGSFSFQK